MFFGDPALAFTNIARALRPGGRLAMAVWQDLAHNEWLRAVTSAVVAGRVMPAPTPDAPGPLSLGRPERIRSILTTAGFGDIALEGLDAPMHFGADTAEAVDFFTSQTESLLRDADPATRERALGNPRDTVTAHDTGHGVYFQSGAWIVTATVSR